MDFQNVEQLIGRFSALGAVRIFCKALAENDNSKQQVYLGSSFETLSLFPTGEVRAYPGLDRPNFKASLDFYWVSREVCEQAPGAQLILYPQYPEVRLSGFVNGCRSAPRAHMRPIAKDKRTGFDGRILVFGVTADNRTLAALAPSGSAVAQELAALIGPREELFFELTLAVGSAANKAQLLDRLREIHEAGLHRSCRMLKNGTISPYDATNGAGYTLEAQLGIKPNSRAEPDYLGWEIKAYSKSRITLMTPEPNGGMYGREGVAAFVRKYGHSTTDALYFTGTHRVGELCAATDLKLSLRGFDLSSSLVTDVDGAIELVDGRGELAASWAFDSLLSHWNRKHAFAAYVPYSSQADPRAYQYRSPVTLGEHTDFSLFLLALAKQAVVFDPGSKVGTSAKGTLQVKARSQFRISMKSLGLLYRSVSQESLTR